MWIGAHKDDSCTGSTAFAISRIRRAAFIRIGAGAGGGVFHAAALSSLSVPRATIVSASSGDGRWDRYTGNQRAESPSRRAAAVTPHDWYPLSMPLMLKHAEL